MLGIYKVTDLIDDLNVPSALENKIAKEEVFLALLQYYYYTQFKKDVSGVTNWPKGDVSRTDALDYVLQSSSPTLEPKHYGSLLAMLTSWIMKFDLKLSADFWLTHAVECIDGLAQQTLNSPLDDSHEYIITMPRSEAEDDERYVVVSTQPKQPLRYSEIRG